MAKEIRFSTHAKTKFGVLEKHNFSVSENLVIETILEADKINSGRKNRIVAQKRISTRHVLRVIYEEKDEWIEVVTFYPGRRERYENEV